MEQRRSFFAGVIAGVLLLVTLWPATSTSPAPALPPPPPSTATLAMLSELGRWAAAHDRGFDLFGHRRLYGFDLAQRQRFELFPTSPERRLLEALPYGPLILEAADRYRLDGLLLAAVVQAESGFDASAVSPNGARGLMQLMPTTAASFGAPVAAEPAANVRAGARYLRYLLQRFGDDLELALAAYNAGPATVRRFGGMPPYRETHGYVERVLTNYLRLHHQLWRDTAMQALLEDDGGAARMLAATPLQGSGLVGPLVFAGAGVVVPPQPMAEVADALSQTLAELREARRAEQQHDDAEDDEQLGDAEIGHGDLRGALARASAAAVKVSVAERRGTSPSPNGERDLPVGAPAPARTSATRGRGSV